MILRPHFYTNTLKFLDLFTMLKLLETIVKNCGDLVHKNIAKRDLLSDMVKIVKKKPDFQVKEKILDLIDTWQEAFGGARAKYPQYYAAYSQLLHMGITFPKRAEKPPPVFTPLQTQPLMRNPENGNDADESSKKAEFSPLRTHDSNESSKKPELLTLSANNVYESSKKPQFTTLSLTEFQKPRRIIGDLAKILNSVDPQRKEVIKQEVVSDLVLQCRTYKTRVAHLVNSTSDESLLLQGLSLNDDLQSVLDKHEALLLGASSPSDKLINQIAKHEAHVTSQKLKSGTSQALVPVVDTPLTDTRARQNPGSNTGSGAKAQVLAPRTTSETSETPEKLNPKFDLLSGDHFSTPTSNSFIAIPQIEAPKPTTPLFQQNTIACIDTPPQNNNPQNLQPGHTYSSSSHTRRSQHFSSEQHSFNLNEYFPNMVPPQSKPASQYASGSISLVGQKYSDSPKCEEPKHFPSQQPSFNAHVNLNMVQVPAQYAAMSLYGHGSNPEAGQRYFKQSQCFPSQQPSINPNGSVTDMLPPQYEQMYPYTNGTSLSSGQAYSSSSQLYPSKSPSFDINGSISNMVHLTSPYSQGSNPAWNGHIPRHQQQHQRQPSSSFYGAQTRHGVLPPPPWEAEPTGSSQSGNLHYPQTQGLHTLESNNNQATDVYMQYHIAGSVPSSMSHKPGHPRKVPQQQITTVCPSLMTHGKIHLEQYFHRQHTTGFLAHHQIGYTYPQQTYNDPMAQTCSYDDGYRYRYGYTPLQTAPVLDRRMSRLSVRDDSFQTMPERVVYANPSVSNASSLHMPSQNPTVPEKKLFNDLVQFNTRPNKVTGSADSI